VLAELPGNYALRGDPSHLDDSDLANVTGFVEAPPEWLPALRTLDPATAAWDRMIAVLRARGHVPTWSTSPGNTGSLAVAARLGFAHVREDVLYAVRTPVPASRG
jgi:hypothetical protein